MLAQIQQAQARTLSALEKYTQDTQTSPKLSEAMKYSLLGGGKRIRPALCLATAYALDQDESKVDPVACALEMIHCYSLVHDDLPAMDDDSLRRGKATNHIKFGEAQAILAGDGLLTLAFEVLSDSRWAIDSEAKLACIATIAKAAGCQGMVAGQSLDLLYEGQTVGEKELLAIHNNKTGALLRASVVASGIACGAKQSQITALENYGNAIGLAFQIADDILDCTQSSQTLGKDAGSDLEKNKATYPAVFGLEKAKSMATEQKNLALTALAPFGERGRNLVELANFIIDRSY